MSGDFLKILCSGKDCVEAFNFCMQIKKDAKYVKEFKETIRYSFLLFFLGPFIFSSTTAYCKPD